MVVEESCNVRQREDIQDGTRALTPPPSENREQARCCGCSCMGQEITILGGGLVLLRPISTFYRSSYRLVVLLLSAQTREGEGGTQTAAQGRAPCCTSAGSATSGSAFIGSQSAMFRTRKRSFRKICLEFRLNTNCCTNHSE